MSDIQLASKLWKPHGLSCTNCQTDKTPLWRRSYKGDLLCNACGLYAKSRNEPRPISNRSNACSSNLNISPYSGTFTGNSHCNNTTDSTPYYGYPDLNQHSRPTRSGNATLSCVNCASTTTPLWRRDNYGAIICNACGLYFKIHRSHRPITMSKTIIKRRNRSLASQSYHKWVMRTHPNLPNPPKVTEQDESTQLEKNPQVKVALTDSPLVIPSYRHQLSHILHPSTSPDTHPESYRPPPLTLPPINYLPIFTSFSSVS